jgi:hypothetical protein
MAFQDAEFDGMNFVIEVVTGSEHLCDEFNCIYNPCSVKEGLGPGTRIKGCANVREAS